uniref:Aspartyl proteinase n=1 Tax=Ganoderma boninense TaxID=34458 RepID=A0A5K1K368_9APHY|nr:Aspartyl proteinase [Ganoderma boninense]
MFGFRAPEAEGLPEVTVSPITTDLADGDGLKKRRASHVEGAEAEEGVAIASVRRDEPIVTRMCTTMEITV